MMETLLSETGHSLGFVIRRIEHEKQELELVPMYDNPESKKMADEMKQSFSDAPETFIVENAYNLNGDYVGDVSRAEFLYGRGIMPEIRNLGQKVCSIGFCANETKWYGWSHRAIFGFGVGSKIKRGDCAYAPKDWNDFTECSIEFWNEADHLNVSAKDTMDADGTRCVYVDWTVADTVPNKAIHGHVHGSYMYPPDEWGKGEWTAKTIEDAKQMAKDFAEGVS